MVWTDNI